MSIKNQTKAIRWREQTCVGKLKNTQNRILTQNSVIKKVE